MEIEREIRFYPVDKRDVTKKLELMGFRCSSRLFCQRIIYDIDPSIRKFLRIRREEKELAVSGDKANSIRISIKQINDPLCPEGTLEKEFDILMGHVTLEEVKKLFDGIGLTYMSWQENYRTTFSGPGGIFPLLSAPVKITIDTWPHINPLLEIEYEYAEDAAAITGRLGLSQPFSGGIAEIYKREHGISLSDFLELKELRFDCPLK
jgi:hypothetical protein